MEWLTANWQEILTVYIPQVITVASIVVRLTPTDVDNQILEKLLQLFEAVALNRK